MLETNAILNPPPKKPRYVLWAFLLVVIAVALAAIFIPYKNIAAQKVTEKLEESGLKVSDLKIDTLNNSETFISHIELGDDKHLSVSNISAKYNIQDAVKGQLQSVSIDKIVLDIYKDENNWTVGGLEKLLNKSSDKNTNIDLNSLYNKLPETISIKDINLTAKDFIMNLKFEMVFDKLKKEMSGKVGASFISIPELPIDILNTKINTEFSANSKDLKALITLAGSINMDAEVAADSSDIKKGIFKIKKFTLPYGGGVVSINNLSIPLAMDKPITIPLNIKEVELSELLGKATSGEIKGDGKLSGVIKMIYYPDGNIAIKDGAMKSNADGIINVSPTLIPGDNEQVKMTRTVMENFHYDILDVSIVADKNEKSLINMVIEGKNPSYLDGRKVKLNINLSGDTIPMLKQSLLPINDFKKLIDSGNKDAK
jgi:hypothetical protein